MSHVLRTPVRVLVVEDSPTSLDYLVALLETDEALAVVGTARDGEEAVKLTERLRPNVVLMDVHMPRVDGYEATRRIMESVPTPVVIVSASLDLDDAAAALEALKVGALTLVPKPPGPGQPGHLESAQTLIDQVRLMAEVKVVRRRHAPPTARPAAPPRRVIGRRIRVIAIGASTGGPEALATILSRLPASLPCPVLVVQHIAPGFVDGLARVLREDAELAVKQAVAHEVAAPGTVYLAPDDHQMGISSSGRLLLSQDAAQNGFRPSASYLLESVARSFGPSALGVVLTGMSGDGAGGLKTLREAGGVTIAQDEPSSVVFGMPKEAIRIGAAEYVLPPAQIAATIRSLTEPNEQGA